MYSAASGTATGVSTPHTAASLRPLNISYGPIDYTLLVSTAAYFSASLVRDEFLSTLPLPSEDLAGEHEPASVTELLSRFLGFLAKKSDEEANQFDDVLNLVLNEFESRFLHGNDVHVLATKLQDTSDEKRLGVIRDYYAARLAANRPIRSHQSALFQAGLNGKAIVQTIFGGQGNTEEYFDEIRQIYSVYKGFLEDILQIWSDKLLVLAQNENANKLFPKGLDLMQWLRYPETTPDLDYMVNAPASLPLIAVSQFAHYAVTCSVLGLSPGQFRDSLSGATGHSQGVITAVAIASSSSWDSFVQETTKALTTLFWIGVRSQQDYPRTSLAPSILQDSVAHAEGRPTPMLAIANLNREQVDNHIKITNEHLPKNRHVGISLVNGPRSFIVSGPPQTLYGLNLSLRKLKADKKGDQNRVPHSQRKLRFTNRFLPITAPFHSPYLLETTKTILDDLQDISFDPSNIAIPVFDTFSGVDLRSECTDGDSVLDRLINLITNLPVHWQAATSSKATHILDFGPGGASGLGVLTHKNKEGSGVRIIIATALEGSFNEVGYMAETFDRDVNSLVYAQNWVSEFSPKLIKNSKGHTFVDTKFSRLLGQPPIMVAGMTPTTVPADFVAATMNAGYHIELAGGGYFSAPGMTQALEYIENHTTPGDGITVNLIYVNPVMMQWAIPLLRQLRAKGVPIEGLTIGAGVPSLEVSKEYIETLGLRYLGLKPGSIDAIYRCISIAKDNPKFPIVVQWTGGRAGGHHSYEDFHYAILQTYSKLRRCDNIILVVGSGFGGADDTYPYLTGEWSVAHDHPPMPFDGVLFGSRMMTAKEAHTSHGAKLAIKDAPGVKDTDWEKSYEGPIGGVVTVLSEMGEPIHKLATRGVMFWRELDNSIFNLPKAKRVAALLHKKDYIVKKLNADFQKPWFGRKSDGQVCDIDDMTYIEILNRLVELMFVKKENRWIDPTLRNLTGNFIRRIEERFAHNDSQVSILQSFSELDHPFAVIEKVAKSYPLASTQLVNAQDKDYFLNLTLNRAQKPVPFVPVLDDNFEFYFKKDSLWQSEDLAAVVGEDVQRTCILQGPVAARYSTEIDVPVKDILDSIHNGHISYLLKEVYHGDSSRIPVIEYFGDAKPEVKLSFETLTITEERDSVLYQLDESASPQALPDVDSWLKLLGGSTPSWKHALFNASIFVQGRKYVTNPLKNILAPSAGLTVEVSNPQDNERTRYSVIEKIGGKSVTTVTIDKDGETITLTLYEERSASGRAVGLPLLLNYHPEQGFAPIHEIVEGRNDRIKKFYWRLWFGDSEPFEYGQVDAEINGGTATVTKKDIADFVLAVGNRGEAFVERPGKVTYAPMDFAIVVGWKAIIKAIFPKVIDGDLLELVHLSNSFKMVGGAEPLKEGDVVSTKANINAVINQDAGKLVEVSAILYRGKEPVMEIVSQFLYRGTYGDFNTTFQRKKEAPIEINFKTTKDVAVFKAKEWVDLDDPDLDLLDKILTFRLETVETYRNQKVFSSVKTTGQILLELPTKEVIQIGSVDYEAGTSHGNPVIDYLQRCGTTIEQPVLFENSIPLNNGTEIVIKAPASNEPYAKVSGDFNPIHVSRAFSKYANLPGTITHGMYSSAAIRSQVEVWAAENHIARVRAFTCTFVGMVLPNDDIEINLHHVGMINGRKIVKVEAVKKETQETVISGEAEIDQPVSTYMFTGQGSQEQGMGMDLYNSSPVAKDVWDRADRHFLNNFGFSIINIVKNNPKELTVYFGGERGKAIRYNYTSMIFESVDADGKVKAEKIFKDIDENSTSFTFKSPTGLLSATQFTQPALTLMEKASFEDMKSKGLVASNSSFAGHSLGEYSALASLGDVMPIESLVDVVFYRGMTMQVAVPRDQHGRSNYGMCAVNPSRISPSFNDAALRYVVDFISEQTKWLLEIVNYNVENTQYVTAGDLRALDTLTNVLNFLKVKKIDLDGLIKSMPIEKVGEHLSEIVTEIAAKSEAKPQPIDLERGFAVIPLKGISVPFHSSYLRNGVKPFHRFLEKRIPKSAIKPANLIDRYIPNLTAKPFEITKEYFQNVYDLTGSARVKNIIDNWDSYERS